MYTCLLTFVNFIFIEKSTIKWFVSSSICWKDLGFIHPIRGLEKGVNIISSVLPLELVGNDIYWHKEKDSVRSLKSLWVTYGRIKVIV